MGDLSYEQKHSSTNVIFSFTLLISEIVVLMLSKIVSNKNIMLNLFNCSNFFIGASLLYSLS